MTFFSIVITCFFIFIANYNLKNDEWKDSETLKFFLLFFSTAFFSYVPALLYFRAPKEIFLAKSFLFLLGVLVFMLFFSLINSNTLKFIILRTSDIIKVSEKTSWEYYIDSDIAGIFDDSIWDKNCRTLKNNCVIAKSLYKTGSINLFCPSNTKVNHLNIKETKEKTKQCIILDSYRVIKIQKASS